jgi:hypothetical protein
VKEAGPIYGRDAIKKYYARLFQHVQFANHASEPDQYSPHVIGTAGNEVLEQREMECNSSKPWPRHGKTGGLLVREGDAWKVRTQIWNITPSPAPAGEMK